MKHSNDQPDYIGYPDLQTIDYALSTEDRPGYEAHAACTLDGFPGEVILSVNTKRPEYSRFEVVVFDDRRYEWRTVYSLTSEQAKHYVGHLGVISDNAETLTQLNRLARILRAGGYSIMRAGRERRQDVMLDYERQLGDIRDAAQKARWDRMKADTKAKMQGTVADFAPPTGADHEVTIPPAADLGPDRPGNIVVALNYDQAEEFAESDLRSEPDDIQEG